MQSQQRLEKTTSSKPKWSFFRLFFLGWITSVLGRQAVQTENPTVSPLLPDTTRVKPIKLSENDTWNKNIEKEIKKLKYDTFLSHSQDIYFQGIVRTLKNMKAFLHPSLKTFLQMEIENNANIYLKTMNTSSGLVENNIQLVVDSNIPEIEIQNNKLAVNLFMRKNLNSTGECLTFPTVKRFPLRDMLQYLMKNHSDWHSLSINTWFLINLNNLTQLPLSHQKFVCQQLKDLEFELNYNTACAFITKKSHYEFLKYYGVMIICIAIGTCLIPRAINYKQKSLSLHNILNSYLKDISLKDDRFAEACIEKHLIQPDHHALFLEKKGIDFINDAFEKIFKHHSVRDTQTKYLSFTKHFPIEKEVINLTIYIFIEIILMFLHHNHISNIKFQQERYFLWLAEFLISGSITYPLSSPLLSNTQISLLKKLQQNFQTLDSNLKKAKSKKNIPDSKIENVAERSIIFDENDLIQQQAKFDEVYTRYQEKMEKFQQLYNKAIFTKGYSLPGNIQSFINKKVNFDKELKTLENQNSPEVQFKNLKNAISKMEENISFSNTHNNTLKGGIKKYGPSLNSHATTTSKPKEQKAITPLPTKKIIKKDPPKKPVQPIKPVKEEKKSIPSNSSFFAKTSKPSALNIKENQVIKYSKNIFGDLLTRYQEDEKNVPAKEIPAIKMLLKIFIISVVSNESFPHKNLRNNCLYTFLQTSDNFSELWIAAEECYHRLCGQINDSKLGSPLLKKMSGTFLFDQQPVLKKFEPRANAKIVQTIMDDIDEIYESSQLTLPEKKYLAFCLSHLKDTFLSKVGVPISEESDKAAKRFRHGSLR